jgi:hypothetical protein
MKAIDCFWHNVCRYQQTLNMEGLTPEEIEEVCWANAVNCNDRSLDMDKRCKMFIRVKNQAMAHP